MAEEAEIKVPFPSGKTDANVVGQHVTERDGSWNFIEECAPSTAEQRARFLNAQASPFEFGYRVTMTNGKLVSTLWGRVADKPIPTT